MKGFFIFITCLTNFFSSALFNVASADIHASAPQNILILKSKNSRYYDQTIQGIQKTFNHNATFSIDNIENHNTQNNIALIITLGVKAAEYSRQTYPDNTKILAFITALQSQQLGLNNNELHLLIEQSPMKYIQFAQTILPHKKIGILFQKNTYDFLANETSDVKFFEVERQSNIILATRQVIKATEVLLALPNKDIYNKHSLKGILLSTFQNGTPLVSYSPAHVKAGALAAIYASPLNLGEHITKSITLLNQSRDILNTRQYAHYYSISINRRVARSLDLFIPDDLKILIAMKEKPSP